ncbi:PDZ domain-containing protein [Fictibacillus enclensis]|uniref:PDZ domain-containing protein n=1 Tax=Fictibacillus enclensis TaxID=1017270 RepID=UPI0025A16891|nr:PDZ domain-containing protein [Fictibacillus enclensis]MDM5335857.1 PDZ domain-containing protein [Fictibacillus enclensis]
MNNSKYESVNVTWIEKPISDVWWYFSTAEGWKAYLSDITSLNSKKESIELGDTLEIIIGELTNKTTCIEYIQNECISFKDDYSAVLPNGDVWEYSLITSFLLEEIEPMTKITVKVEGYTDDEMMQWVRECGEMGWQQSLFNLKSIIELGIDVRNDIFNYPRLGVLNFTASSDILLKAGLDPKEIEGNYIRTVYPNGPAAEAGIQEGDIITEIGRTKVRNYKEFVKALGKLHNKESSTTVKLFRNQVQHHLNLELTYNDQFTGMIDPDKQTVEELIRDRKGKV